MGLVTQAQHLHLQAPLALKFMLPEAVLLPGAVERFLREARAASSLRSPHIVTVHDVDRLDDGTPYIAMDLLEGEDLAQRLERGGPLPVAEAVACAIQLCRGLAEAHRRGVIHRDLKPANLFLVRQTDGSQLLKVLDFGISKTVSSSMKEGLPQMGALQHHAHRRPRVHVDPRQLT
jgi:serine/threonine-protein kinase